MRVHLDRGSAQRFMREHFHHEIALGPTRVHCCDESALGCTRVHLDHKVPSLLESQNWGRSHGRLCADDSSVIKIIIIMRQEYKFMSPLNRDLC